MEAQRFAIVQWIDKFTSIINLDAVKFPRKPTENYSEGEYITALYGNRKYRARISEISGDRIYLASRKTSNGAYPLNYVYEDQMEAPQNDDRTATNQPTDSAFLSVDLSAVTDSDIQSNADEQAGSSSSEVVSNLSSVDTLPLLNDSSPAASSETVSTSPSTPVTITAVSLHSSKRKLEKKVEQLEKDVRELRGFIKSLSKKVRVLEANDSRTQANSSGHVDPQSSELQSSQAASTDRFDQLMGAVSHLSGQEEKDVNAILKRTSLSVFSRKDLTSCTRTGKKTTNAGDAPKPALDKTKLNLVEKVVLTKCPGITVGVFNKKFDNLLKMERRSEVKGKKTTNDTSSN